LGEPSSCPVCGDTSLQPLKHTSENARGKTKLADSSGYRCSKGHIFEKIPKLMEVRRSRQLQEQARDTVTKADQQIAKAKELLAKKRRPAS
jgi:hypothetical protein